MGIVLQIIGVFVLLASLVFGVLAILNQAQSIIAVMLLVVAGTLIRTGRSVYKNGDKKEKP